MQFVTFRLAESLPQTDVQRRRSLSKVEDIDDGLDEGLGACWLKRPEIASLVQTALLHFDTERYKLPAWCLMPNHVHAVVEVLEGHSLSDVLRSWKAFSGREANKVRKRGGPLWDADYFDRYMRNEQHLGQTIEYVETTQ